MLHSGDFHGYIKMTPQYNDLSSIFPEFQTSVTNCISSTTNVYLDIPSITQIYCLTEAPNKTHPSLFLAVRFRRAASVHLNY